MSTARFAHVSDFRLITEAFARVEVLQVLGVDRRTLARWLAGASRIPWAAYQLLRDRSCYGLAERDAAEGFNRRMLLLLVDALRRRVAELEAELARQARLVDWRCANDPFIEAQDPRSQPLELVGLQCAREDHRPRVPAYQPVERPAD